MHFSLNYEQFYCRFSKYENTTIVQLFENKFFEKVVVLKNMV